MTTRCRCLQTRKSPVNQSWANGSCKQHPRWHLAVVGLEENGFSVRSNLIFACGWAARTHRKVYENRDFSCGWRTRTRKLDFRVRVLKSPVRENKKPKKNKISKKKAIRRWRRRSQPPPPPPCHRHRRPRRPRMPLPPSSEAAAASMPPAAGIHAPLQPHHCRRAPPTPPDLGREGRGGEGRRGEPDLARGGWPAAGSAHWARRPPRSPLATPPLTPLPSAGSGDGRNGGGERDPKGERLAGRRIHAGTIAAYAVGTRRK